MPGVFDSLDKMLVYVIRLSFPYPLQFPFLRGWDCFGKAKQEVGSGFLSWDLAMFPMFKSKTWLGMV